jgi:hypothetical protein
VTSFAKRWPSLPLLAAVQLDIQGYELLCTGAARTIALLSLQALWWQHSSCGFVGLLVSLGRGTQETKPNGSQSVKTEIYWDLEVSTATISCSRMRMLHWSCWIDTEVTYSQENIPLSFTPDDNIDSCVQVSCPQAMNWSDMSAMTSTCNMYSSITSM